MARQAALPKEAPRGGDNTSSGAKTRAGSTQELSRGAQGPQARAHSSASAADARTAADLDRLIHERVRLAIVSALAVNQSLTFNDLKQMLNTTDGNLSVHARKLEEANYVTCTKFFDGRTPKTEYRLTASGRRALERYLSHMESIIRKTREG